MIAAAAWCDCTDKEPVHIPLRGRLVVTECDDGTRAERLMGACVRCRRAILVDGSLGSVQAKEQRYLHNLARPVMYARDSIARGIEPNADELPTVEQITELGCPYPISPNVLDTDHEALTDDQIRASFRALFGIPDRQEYVSFKVPGLSRAIIVGADFVDHPLTLARRRDPGHMLYAPLTPKTVRSAAEVWMQRTQAGGRSFVFLGVYVDISGAKERYVYHVAYALGDGRLNSSFCLAGGAPAFRKHRVGRLLHASYAEPLHRNLVAVA